VTLDLHNIYDRSEEIERALRPIIKQTVAKKALIDKIIPGKGFGQRPCCAAACEGRARSRAVDRVPPAQVNEVSCQLGVPVAAVRIPCADLARRSA
jgi:hypothetical protein